MSEPKEEAVVELPKVAEEPGPEDYLWQILPENPYWSAK